MLKYILFASVVVLYLFSTMGYGVHKCSSEGTADVVLLFGETPCEYLHSHIDEHGRSYTHSHATCSHTSHTGYSHNHSDEESAHVHGDECCSTNVYVLTQDQDTAEYNVTPAPEIIHTFHLMADVSELVSDLAGTTIRLSENLLRDCELQVSQAVLCSFRV